LAGAFEREATSMRRIIVGLLAGLLLLTLSACGAEPPQEAAPESPAPMEETPAPLPVETEEMPQTDREEQGGSPADTEEEEKMLRMQIGETEVAVDGESNASVEALRELCRKAPLTISMSMYGGFEQVGAIGARLPRNDVQTTTAAGDIVLYAGSQLVVFYGSNSWAYTRLGHISDQSVEELPELLGNGDVAITLQLK